MHYKTIVKMRYFKKLTQVFQRPCPFNTRANLKNLGTVLFLRAQGIRKSFYRQCFHSKRAFCLRMVEDRKFSAF